MLFKEIVVVYTENDTKPTNKQEVLERNNSPTFLTELFSLPNLI
jgi:hypothetical protein